MIIAIAISSLLIFAI